MSMIAHAVSMGLTAASGIAPLGHWPLENDAHDVSSRANHGSPNGVVFTDGHARFDGRGAHIEIPYDESLGLGADFSIGVWVHTERALDDTLGDILSRFDDATQRGFSLGIQSFAGVTSAQSNARHVQCTLGTGNDAGQWADCGRPGNALFITSLAVCEGALYAGTCEPDAGQSGHVYRYDEGAWVDCGSPDASNSVYALAVLDGVLHAGTGRYKTSGSALPDSPNQHPGGRVFRYANGAWVDCGRLGGEDSEADTVGAMAVFNGHLYATPMYHKGVYRYDGGTTWAFCGVPTGDIPGPMFGAEAGEETPGCRLISLTVHDGHLYAAGNGRDQGIFRYDGGEAWTNVGKPAGVDQVYSFMQYRGRLYTGTWPKAEVFRWDGGDTWTSCGCLADELEVMAMMTYAGELYAGSLPLAAVYRYDGRDGWEYSERLDHTPDMKYRRVWSMAVYEGKLFCGTLPSGHVHAFDAGACITHDHELQPGWRHIAAVRRGNALRLFVDGRLVAARDIPADLDAVTEGPLFVGFGPHDYFNGRMRDLRIYGQALSDADVSALHADRPKGIE